MLCVLLVIICTSGYLCYVYVIVNTLFLSVHMKHGASQGQSASCADTCCLFLYRACQSYERQHRTPLDMPPWPCRKTPCKAVGCACLSTQGGGASHDGSGVLASTTFPLFPNRTFAHDLPHPSRAERKIHLRQGQAG